MMSEDETGFRVESDLHQLQRTRCERCGRRASVSVYVIKTKGTAVLCQDCADARMQGPMPLEADGLDD
jgi:transcription elongation factor Elf1